MRFYFLIAVLLFLSIKQQTLCHKHSTSPMLLLISFDGFRWDYFDMYNLTNFKKLRQNSSYADYIYNSFATVTFSNHWTIVTGLYEESHGIVQNDMYDPVLKKVFDSSVPETFTIEWFGQNKQTEPIWVSNQKAGSDRRSAAEWVGAEVVFDRQNITYIPYNKTTPYVELIDKFISLFVDPNGPINFGALYFDQPDRTGHMYGPYSQQIKDKLESLDNILGYLIDQLKSHHLYDKLDLIITSDHGMESISKEKTIFLDSYVDTTLFDAYGSRACYNLFIKNHDNLENVYNKLKTIAHIDVYKHDDIPSKLNYKNNVRIGDIVIFTHVGYTVYINNKTIDWEVTNGEHGYYNDIPSMYPFFMAHGPSFKKNHKIKSFYNVDIYPLMCYILGIEGQPNNGSLSRVVDLLQLRIVDDNFGLVFISLLIIPISIVGMTLMFIWLSGKSSRSKSNNKSNYDYVSVATSETVLANEDPESNDRINLVS